MHIYFMGVCGTAMGNAALLLHGQGHVVSGADTNIYPPMSDLLKASGIRLYNGYDPIRLKKLTPELVVIGNAISRGNPEVEWLWETRSLPYTSLPALLHQTLLQERYTIVVAGTHGKTTTTALTACLLRANGQNPGYFIGGVPRDLPNGAHPGDLAAPFIIEGDEYDCAFFDKRSKFVHYQPSLLILNNLDFDHGDIFRDLADIQRSFEHLLRLVPRNGYVLANGDDANLAPLLSIPWTSVIKVGVGPDNDLRITDFRESPAGATFILQWRGQCWTEMRWRGHGLFNVRNAAMAALGAGFALHPQNPIKLKLDVLTHLKGIKRRQEILYASDTLVVIEDFAHHPTAIAQTLQSLRARYPKHHLTACFEPRSNTARSRIFQNEFCDALKRAQTVFIGAVNGAENLPPEQRLDTDRLAEVLARTGVSACAFADNTTLLEAAAQNYSEQMESPRVVCFFSNGSFDGIIQAFVERVQRDGAKL